MRSVNRDDVGLEFGHFDGALEKIAGCADCGAHAEPALLVFCGAGIFELFLNVFYGDEAFEVEVLINH